jgi:hypothetical protein
MVILVMLHFVQAKKNRALLKAEKAHLAVQELLI